MISLSEEGVRRLSIARSITVLTGAGASADSGIPTFRDPGGLWEGIDPMELASRKGFRNDPVRVQSWYASRMAAVRRVEPNACHRAIAELETLVDEVTVITQNIDGLHQRAGSTRVIELHGNLSQVYCVDCGKRTDELRVDVDASAPALCDCGGLLRPNVVWFGEVLPARALQAAFSATKRADVMLSIGTSGEVYPAAGLPAMADEHGAYVIEINTQDTALSDFVDESLFGAAAAVMPELVGLMNRRMAGGVESQ